MSSKQVVVVKKKAVRVKRPKAAPARGQDGVPRALKGFACALNDPFCLAAQAAKVPDEFAFPTEVSTLRGRFTFTPSAGDVVVCTAHPLVSAIGLNLSGSGASNPALTKVTGNVSTIQVNSVAAQTNTVPYWQAVTAANFKSAFVKYRTVGWGVRIRNITAAANVAGDLSVALVPSHGMLPGEFLPALDNAFNVANSPQLISIATMLSAYAPTYSTTNGTYGNPSISGNEASWPVFETITAAEIAQTGGVQITPKIHSPSAWSFRPTVPTASVAGNGIYAYAGTQGAAPTLGNGNQFNADALSCDGHNHVVIIPSGTAGQTYEVEYVAHLEVIGNTAGATGTGATQASPSPVVDTTTFHRTWTQALTHPWIEFAKHEGSKAFGSVVQMLPGLMTKAAMYAMM